MKAMSVPKEGTSALQAVHRGMLLQAKGLAMCSLGMN